MNIKSAEQAELLSDWKKLVKDLESLAPSKEQTHSIEQTVKEARDLLSSSNRVAYDQSDVMRSAAEALKDAQLYFASREFKDAAANAAKAYAEAISQLPVIARSVAYELNRAMPAMNAALQQVSRDFGVGGDGWKQLQYGLNELEAVVNEYGRAFAKPGNGFVEPSIESLPSLRPEQVLLALKIPSPKSREALAEIRAILLMIFLTAAQMIQSQLQFNADQKDRGAEFIESRESLGRIEAMLGTVLRLGVSLYRIRKNDCPLRLEPKGRSKLLAKLPDGATVSSNDQIGEWVKIEWRPSDRDPPIVGWIHRENLERADQLPVESAAGFRPRN